MWFRCCEPMQSHWLWRARQRTAIQGRWVRPGIIVHGLEAAPDKPVLVAERPGGHRPAHDDELRLVQRMPDLVQLRKPRRHLGIRIIAVLLRPKSCRLPAGVALRRGALNSARTGNACAVRAASRRGHGSDDRNAGKGSRGLTHQHLERLALFRQGHGRGYRHCWEESPVRDGTRHPFFVFLDQLPSRFDRLAWHRRCISAPT